MKKIKIKKQKVLDKTNGFVIYSSSLAARQSGVTQANWSLKLKGRERRKSQRAKIFGKENKRRTKTESGKMG